MWYFDEQSYYQMRCSTFWNDCISNTEEHQQVYYFDHLIV